MQDSNERNYRQASYREMVVETMFISALLRYLWVEDKPPAEVLCATVDNSGYDIVIECNSVQRHIQMKTSTKSRSRIDLNKRLALKKSGCVVWIIINPKTLDFEKFYWLGGNPGEPLALPPKCGKARHPRRNKQGERPIRENTRSVPRGAFTDLGGSIPVLAKHLFGCTPPMNIHSVRGDIVQFGPENAELSGLWISRNSGARLCMWQQICERYRGALQPHQEYESREVTFPGTHGRHRDVSRPVRNDSNPDCPWLAPNDSILELCPPDGRLKYFYLFSNPNDSQGEPTLEDVCAAVKRCLDAAARLKVKTVSMILIPWDSHGESSSKEQDIASARAMIGAARQWDTANPGQITDLYLVDLDGGFGPLLPPEY